MTEPREWCTCGRPRDNHDLKTAGHPFEHSLTFNGDQPMPDMTFTICLTESDPSSKNRGGRP